MIRVWDCTAIVIVGVAWCFVAVTGHAQTAPDTFNPDGTQLSGYGRFEVRGQYGDVPIQTSVVERDYEWWEPGQVGFWAYHIETGVVVTFRERIAVRLALTTTGDEGDRDYAVWGNDIDFDTRVKQAGIRLDRVWSSKLAIEGGRQAVSYPLFTYYQYNGGRLIFTVSPALMIDWGQWQVAEGRILDRPGEGSDDIDLWGPQARIRTSAVTGAFYALVNSKAGGRDGVSNNVKIVGIDAAIPENRTLTVGATGILQWGAGSDPIIGSHTIRSWAFRGRFRYRAHTNVTIGGEYWSGSGDDPATTNKHEGFQQFGYRNTLEKSTLFYKPGLTDLRLVRGTIQGRVAGVIGRMDIVKIGSESTGDWLETEMGLSIEYPYSEHARLRWRLGFTGDGDRMQVFELSSGFGGE